MHADFPSQPPSQRVQIGAGATRTFVLKAGANVICVAGSIRVEQLAAGFEAASSLLLPVSVRINAGEAHGVMEGGVVRVTGIHAADVICLDVPGPIHRLFALAAKIFRQKTPESTKNRLGALHKIS